MFAAEDNAANRHVLRVLLEPLAVTLTLVENGREAVDAMAREAFDIVLMDANMPVMDGLEATRAIRPLSVPQPRIIAMTAAVTADDAAACYAAGMNDYLPKPVKLEQLKDALFRVGAG